MNATRMHRKVSRMLPSTLPHPPASLALGALRAVLALRDMGERSPSLGAIVRTHAVLCCDGQVSPTHPADVQRGIAPLVALRAVYWGSDGRLYCHGADGAACLQRELDRLAPPPKRRKRRAPARRK